MLFNSDYSTFCLFLLSLRPRFDLRFHFFGLHIFISCTVFALGEKYNHHG